MGGANPSASAISAPAPPPFNQGSPGCRITFDRKAAAYVVVFTAAKDAADKWAWAIHEKNGILLEKGQAATLARSAKDVVPRIMAYWQKRTAR